jgi:peptidyl-prolyl cis-trans isomerase C
MRTVTLRPAEPRPPVAVNDVAIPPAAIAQEVQHHAGGSPQAAWQAATQALVVRELLLQRARACGVTATPRSQDGLRETEEEALIRTLLETEVRIPSADAASCRRIYDANPARFRTPDLYEPLHILFQADAADAQAYATALAQAEAALAALRAAPDRFESLARSLSACSSAQDGGRLGQVTRGETTPAFEAAMVALEPGQLCPEPVQTLYGVHVLRLDRKVAGLVPPFEAIQPQIAAWLEETAWRRGVAQYLSLLAGQATITGCALPSASSPLVQ